MARVSRLKLAKAELIRFFDERRQTVYTLAEMGEILEKHGASWRLALRTNAENLVSFLVENAKLRRVVLESKPLHRKVERFVWGEATSFAVAQSLRPDAYLSHGTAVFLHGLNDQIPRTIYVNKEQGKKPRGHVQLDQERLRLAFSRSQRLSSYVLTDDKYRIVLLSGKHTERLGVVTVPGPIEGERLDTTSVERTLIDITVRPAYAGGVDQVLAAFKGARDHVSVNALLAMLKKLDYVYPYHQAIGFYMTRAGYAREQIARVKRIPIRLDFYLAHGMRKTGFNREWRLFAPKGF